MGQNKVKGKKMDPNWVSNRKWEINYIAFKLCVKPEEVIIAKEVTGRSRHKLYNYLRSLK